jgi:hypothetical protein
MSSHRMLRRVALVRTDVSEEHSASIMRVTRRQLLVTVNVVLSSPICQPDDGGRFLRNVGS